VASPTGSEEAASTKFDAAVSDACSRSGAFALLLSLALLSVIPYWWERQDNIALGRYVTSRLTLGTAIDLFDEDVYWQEYKSSNENAESKPISELAQARVEVGTAEASKPAPRPKAGKRQKITQRSTAPPSAPAPPTGLRASVTATIDEMRQIADSLSTLDDSDVLTRSRAVSVFYNVGIYRWVWKRNTLLNRNIYGHHCEPKATQTQESTHPETYVPAVGRDILLECLTLQDVRELADFELPRIPDTTRFGVRGEKEVDVSPGSFPRDLYLASLFVQVVVLFVIIYFNAFAREAVSSSSFPARGTLFGAFSRSRWTLAVFALILWVPFLASAAVATLSREWPLAICAALIGCVVVSTNLLLQRRKYWGTRSFRFLAPNTRSKGDGTSAHQPTKTEPSTSSGPPEDSDASVA
jgi:hypothetical protein